MNTFNKTKGLPGFKHISLVCLASIIIGFITASTDTFATTYRWTDAQGRVHYSDSPPPKNAKNIKIHKASSSSGQVVSNEPALPTVILFTAATCNGCQEAKALLHEMSVPFEEKLMRSQEDVEEYKNIVGSEPFVPTMMLDSSPLKGFNGESWKNSLNNVGFGKPGTN